MAERPVTFDPRRVERTGLEEAVLCADKSPIQIEHVLEAAAEKGAERLLLTRLEPNKLRSLPETWRRALDYDESSRTAVLGELPELAGPARVAVVSAGTSDTRVSGEAVRTLRYYGEASVPVHDVGVAGLWRLLERVEELRSFPVILAVAGMDGALPTVLAGLVPSLIIAVPTSTGYGVADNGRTALHAALTSCSSGLTAVNIDNGYGAACAALRVVRALT